MMRNRRGQIQLIIAVSGKEIHKVDGKYGTRNLKKVRVARLIDGAIRIDDFGEKETTVGWFIPPTEVEEE